MDGSAPLGFLHTNVWDDSMTICIDMKSMLVTEILIAYGERTGLIGLSATAGH